MVEHALACGYEVVGVCRSESVGKPTRFGDRITVFPGRTNDRLVVERAVMGCDGVLTMLVAWDVEGYATGIAQPAVRSRSCRAGSPADLFLRLAV